MNIEAMGKSSVRGEIERHPRHSMHAMDQPLAVWEAWKRGDLVPRDEIDGSGHGAGKTKPILCLDFDGVMHSYTSGWQGAETIPDRPVEGLFPFLSAAMDHFRVAVFSSRSNQPGGIDAMRDWLRFWHTRWLDDAKDTGVVDAALLGLNLSRIEWPTEKPPAMVTIDDRAVCFDGTWPRIDDLLRFRPWNKVNGG